MRRIFMLCFLLALVCVKGWGQTVTIGGKPTVTSVNLPINSNDIYSGSEEIYLGSEIGITGNIGSISFDKNNSGFNIGFFCSVNVYMKLTDSTTVSTRPSSSGYTLVYSGQFPNSRTGLQTIYLDSAFSYDKAHNLSILIFKTNYVPAIPNPKYNGTSYPTFRASYYISNDLNYADSTFIQSNVRPNIQIAFFSNCSGKPIAGAAVASLNLICAGDSSVLSLPNASYFTGLKFQWMSSPSKAGTYTNIAGATKATYVAQPTSKTFYKCLLTCSITKIPTDTTYSGSDSVYLTPKPIVTVTPTTDAICSGGSILLKAAGADTYKWTPTKTLSDSTGNSVTATPTKKTTYTVTGTKTSNGCTATATSTISLNPLPTATIIGTTTLCQNSPSPNITFTGTAGTAPFTFTYNINGGSSTIVTTTSGSAVTVSQATTTPGSYVYNLLKVQDGSSTHCSSAASGSATVTVNNLDTVFISNYNTTVCNNNTAQVQVAGTIGDKVTYNFNGGSNTQVTLVNDGAGHGVFNYTTPVLTTASSSSTYTFTIVSVISSTGCASTITNAAATITVYAYPVVAAISGGGAYIAVDSTTTLTDATSPGKWSSDNNNIATIDAIGVVKGIAAGTDSIRYTVTGAGGCASSVSTAIHVYSQLVADFRTSKSGNFSDKTTWEYAKGDGNYLPATFIPSPANSIIVTHKLLLDVDDTIGTGKTFLLNTTVATDTFVVAPGKVLTVIGAANFNNKTVLLRSTAAGTAQMGGTVIITGAGKVTAERYIPLTTINSQGTNRAGRAWRLITSPISDATINQAWQEGVLTTDSLTRKNPSPSYGTNITGTQQYTAANANAHGFDFWPAIGNKYSSIRVYHGAPVSANENWADTTSILNVKVSSYPAYLLFVRGNRDQFSPPDASITTLRATGLLRQTQADYKVYDSANKQARSLIGNPYAATLDFDKVLSANSTLIKPLYWRWDAANGIYGGYTLVQKFGSNYYTVPAPFNIADSTRSAQAQYIESGEGFLVEPVKGSPGGTLSILPAHKTTSGVTVSPFRIVPPPQARMFINLNLYSTADSSSALADGVLASFDDDAVSNSDVAKPYNLNENIGLDKDINILTVMAHPALVTIADTLHLRLWNTTPRSYQIQVKAENWNAAGLRAYLLDNYLHTTSPISLSGDISTVTFTLNTDAASADQHRFSVIFTSAILPVTITKVTAYKKTDGSVNVDWLAAGETGIKEYTVERSFNGRDFTPVATVAAGNTAGNYSITDHTPGSSDNYYRIRIVSTSGTLTYSAIVKISFSTAGGKTLITLYPNPVQEGITAYLKAENLPAGTYNTALYTGAGQKVQASVIAHSGGSATLNYTLPHILAQGRYTLRIFSSDKKQIAALPVVVVKK